MPGLTNKLNYTATKYIFLAKLTLQLQQFLNDYYASVRVNMSLLELQHFLNFLK